jgi:predicted GTPase
VKQKVIIAGAAGRDFHNFNVFFRNDPDYEVVAFTAAQIPDIAGRKYPASLAGRLYPHGIPIHEEAELPKLVMDYDVDRVVLAYSDLPYAFVMRFAALVNATGAEFCLMGPKQTMLKSGRPVVSVCAVRTGAGKSQTTRRVCAILRQHGKRLVVVRHPMPYGDLAKQAVQRFASYSDLAKHECTIEEREEYEPHLEAGNVLYAGVDYAAILKEAEKEADVIVWDGGNNDLPFYRPDLHIVVADAHRPGHEISYYPGETNVRLADVVIINKVDTAPPGNVAVIEKNVNEINPKAKVILSDSPVTAEADLSGKRVLVVEDGPTLTHGGMPYGAATVAAKKAGATIVDPRPHAVGSIRKVYAKYGHLGAVLPAMGYGPAQVRELQATINAVDCDAVVAGTQIDLARLLEIRQPIVRVRYELKERGNGLEAAIQTFLAKSR